MSLHHPTKADRAAEPAVAKGGLLRLLPWEIRLAVLAIFYLGPPLFLVVAATLAYYTVRIPDPMALRLKEHAPVVRVLARDGSLLERARRRRRLRADRSPAAPSHRRGGRHRGPALLQALGARSRRA